MGAMIFLISNLTTYQCPVHRHCPQYYHQSWLMVVHVQQICFGYLILLFVLCLLKVLPVFDAALQL